MTQVAQLYKTLPSLRDADAYSSHFGGRKPMFENLASLLAQYNNDFGLCFVHTHRKLVKERSYEQSATSPSRHRLAILKLITQRDGFFSGTNTNSRYDRQRHCPRNSLMNSIELQRVLTCTRYSARTISKRWKMDLQSLSERKGAGI